VTISSKSEGEVGTRPRERRGITVLMVKAKNREHIKKKRQKRGADLLRKGQSVYALMFRRPVMLQPYDSS
jgi:hypothetical protein